MDSLILIHPCERERCPFFVYRPDYARPYRRVCHLRMLALAEVRAQLKKRRITYALLTGRTSVGWTGEVMRGHYPHYAAGELTKEIYLALAQRLPVPAELKPSYLP